MSDDIVTRLKNIYTLGQLGVVHEAADEIEDLRAELKEFQHQYKALKLERDKWQDIANRLGTHMGEALYGDEEWSCREYAISAYAEWERTEGAHLTKYQVEPQPRWYFKGGKEV